MIEARVVQLRSGGRNRQGVLHFQLIVEGGHAVGPHRHRVVDGLGRLQRHRLGDGLLANHALTGRLVDEIAVVIDVVIVEIDRVPGGIQLAFQAGHKFHAHIVGDSAVIFHLVGVHANRF